MAKECNANGKRYGIFIIGPPFSGKKRFANLLNQTLCNGKGCAVERVDMGDILQCYGQDLRCELGEKVRNGLMEGRIPDSAVVKVFSRYLRDETARNGRVQLFIISDAPRGEVQAKMTGEFDGHICAHLNMTYDEWVAWMKSLGHEDIELWQDRWYQYSEYIGKIERSAHKKRILPIGNFTKEPKEAVSQTLKTASRFNICNSIIDPALFGVAKGRHDHLFTPATNP